MNKYNRIYDKIDATNPKIIYLSGKTCTGKTTLANFLRDKYGSAIIELDEIISEIDAPEGIDKFVEIYRNRGEVELIHLFTTRVKEEINKALKTHPSVIFEGSIANNKTLLEIVQDWTDQFLFIYLSPINLDVYNQQLKNRLKLANRNNNAGLPSMFWKKFTTEQLEEFYTSRDGKSDVDAGITNFAKESMRESEIRQKMFAEVFADILVVEF